MPTKPATRGYTATKELKRLRRIEGQVRGVQRTVGNNRYCIDVLTQINATHPALDKVALGLLGCPRASLRARGAAGGTHEERTEEMMVAVGRLMRRG